MCREIGTDTEDIMSHSQSVHLAVNNSTAQQQVLKKIAEAGIKIEPAGYAVIENTTQEKHYPDTPVYSWYDSNEFSFKAIFWGFLGLVLMAVAGVVLYFQAPYAELVLLAGIVILTGPVLLVGIGECVLPKKEEFTDYHIRRHSTSWKKLSVSPEDEETMDQLIALFGNDIYFALSAKNVFRKRLPRQSVAYTRGSTVCEAYLKIGTQVRIRINSWTVYH